MNTETSETAVRFGARGITHRYSTVPVLREVDFELVGGNVHALLGENGSGKSTLIKIMTGALQPSEGEMCLNGSPVHFHAPAGAQAAGIGVVHQNYNLIPDLTVEQNIMAVSIHAPRRAWLRSLDHKAVRLRVLDLFNRLSIDIDPRALVRRLGPAERKFVEIARAMMVDPRFLILDEPTASLQPSEAARVLRLMDSLRVTGVGVAFVSHRLDEVLRISDMFTVLRDGALVAHGPNESMDEAALARLMIGARPQTVVRKQVQGSQIALTLRDVAVDPLAHRFSLEVRRGEVLGLTGLVGSGADQVVKMLGGAIPLDGEAEMDGRRFGIASPRNAKKAGIGYIPEDRKAHGLCMEHPISVNISIASLERVSRSGVVSYRQLRQRADEFRSSLDIRLSSVRDPVSSLSGGNQQKVLLAKWLASGVEILAIEEPTQGVDINGKAQIHQLLRDFAGRGGTVVVASTDVREIVELADRVAIFRHGELHDLLDVEGLDEAAITARGASDADHYVAGLIEVDDDAPVGNSIEAAG